MSEWVKMPRTEMESETGLVLARPGQIARLVAGAVSLRCPNCGGRPVMENWFRMRERCPRCGIRIERGEQDYFIGSMMFNLVIAELLFAALFMGYLIVVWPDVPWDFLEWGAPIMMAIAPFILFPFSKLVWLAFDIMLRPVTEAEMKWHHGSNEREG